MRCLCIREVANRESLNTKGRKTFIVRPFVYIKSRSPLGKTAFKN